MKKLPQKATNVKKKGYKHVIGGYGWDLGALVFDKEEPRSKTKQSK